MEQIIFGALIKKLNNSFQRFSEREAHKIGITQAQMSIIDFLYRNERQREIYQTNVEREFNIQKSSATALLKLMEKKGLIVRAPSKKDSRYKFILLTTKSRQLADHISVFYQANNEELQQVLGDHAKRFAEDLSKLQTYMDEQLKP
ncbi:MarR family transcriptional regulator [Secundilactobacillus pentosiphilus]|uniref:MarR family transcriptional regulator n=1 Tax=Secundilactobacillus pentosiphilus TaxID=1714682 RepID=A0A1Z5IX98_9LACO|nr:MarR family winged helix-turn-helix transcriptional regulator [Secundilactobacillus pentosiphilus]GAX06430.1 MarR family transcriptional regulator [Secundilactobacillus pentosiphilus]